MSSANSSRSSAFQSLKKIAIPLLAVCFIWIWTLSGQFTRSEEVIELGSRGRAWKVTEDVAPHRLIDAQPPSKLITTSEEMGTRFQNHQAVDNGNLMHVEGAFTSSAKVCNHKLYTPTYATYVEGIQAHVIVDCWHHRVILLDSSDGVDALHALETPIPLWSDLTNITYVSSSSSSSGGGVVAAAAARKSLQSLNIPHSIATNGDIFVTESSVGGSNGDNHSLLVFRMVAPQSSRSGRPQLEYLEEVLGCDGNRARRPHRVIYDAESKSFFLYMTSPAFLSRFVWNTETQKLERVGCQSLPFMKGMYARSIVAHNGSLYFTAGPGVIWRTELDGVRGVVVAKQSYSIKYLGFTKGKMNDLAFFDGWWYATSTVPCAMVRFRNIDRLWEHEKIHTQLGLCKTFSRKEPRCLGGTPYFVSKIGD